MTDDGAGKIVYHDCVKGVNLGLFKAFKNPIYGCRTRYRCIDIDIDIGIGIDLHMDLHTDIVIVIHMDVELDIDVI